MRDFGNEFALHIGPNSPPRRCFEFYGHSDHTQGVVWCTGSQSHKQRGGEPEKTLVLQCPGWTRKGVQPLGSQLWKNGRRAPGNTWGTPCAYPCVPRGAPRGAPGDTSIAAGCVCAIHSAKGRVRRSASFCVVSRRPSTRFDAMYLLFRGGPPGTVDCLRPPGLGPRHSAHSWGGGWFVQETNEPPTAHRTSCSCSNCH